MDVKAGYKQTEVGIIPEDWEESYLGDKTTKIGSGITPTGGERVYKREGRPFIRSQNVGWGILLMDDIAFIDDATHATFQATQIENDDVFLNITGASIGRSAVADARVVGGNVNQHVCIIRTIKDQLHPRFLKYFLLSKAGQRQIDSFQAGSNRQGLNFVQIRSFHIPLPSTLAEQEAIAEALSDADALIESLEQLIAKKRQVKQGAMQELLTGKRRLSGFEKKHGYKQTEIGIIPEDWEVKRLGELFEITSSKRVFQSQWKTKGIPFYRARELAVLGEQGFVNNELFITREMYNAFKKTYGVPKIGDILVTGVGTLGKVYVVPDEREFYFKDGNIIWFKTSGRVSSEFLRQLYSTPLIIRQIEDNSAGTTVGTYTISGAQKTVIPYPALPEQTAIAEILSDMDAEIDALQAKLAKAGQVKQGMMSVLLTGRVRLV